MLTVYEALEAGVARMEVGRGEKWHVQTGFMGMRRSLMGPNLPKISRMCASLTFFDNASTTICNHRLTTWSNMRVDAQTGLFYLCAPRAGRAVPGSLAARVAPSPAIWRSGPRP